MSGEGGGASMHYRGKSIDGIPYLDNESVVDSVDATPAGEAGLVRTIDGGVTVSGETPFARLNGEQEAGEYFADHAKTS
jgi:hypothetical protein